MSLSLPSRIIATDPGERTGWAHGLVDEAGKLEVTGQGVSTIKDFGLKLVEVAGNYDVIIYETWRLYPEMAKRMIGNDMQPSQMVGMIRLAAWMHPNVRLVSQGARIKKTALKTMPDWMVERMTESSEQHDQDALMHLWYFYWREVICQQAN